MKGNTRAAYRSHAKANHNSIDTELARQKAEYEAQFAASQAAYDAEEAARIRLTRDDILGATAVRTRIYGWRLVRTVNQKTVSIESGYSWATLVPFGDVLAITREAVKR